jgi:hypothetical protein
VLSSNLPRSTLVANLYPVQLLENYTDFALSANAGLFKGDNPCSELNSLDPPPTSVDEQDQLWAMNPGRARLNPSDDRRVTQRSGQLNAFHPASGGIRATSWLE